MSPNLVPVVNARSAVFRRVKRAENHTDAPVVVLAVISVVILTVTLLSIARYFCRESRRNSSSSTDPSSRSPSHWYSPRCLGSLRTGRTATSSHQDPLPALPPRDPVRPWPATYRPTYPRVHFADRPYSHRSHRFGEYRPGSLAVYRLSGLNAYQPGDHPPRRPSGFNAYTPGGLPLHRRPRPYNMKRSRLRTSSPIPEADPVPESSETNDVDVQLSDIPQSHDAQSVRSTPAVVRKTSIGTSEEARISHETVNECDAANDSAPECASGTDTPQAGTDEERLGGSEPSEAHKDEHTGSAVVSLHSTFSDEDDSDIDECGDDDSGKSVCSVEQGRCAVSGDPEPEISPPISFGSLADLYVLEDENDEVDVEDENENEDEDEDEDTISKSYDFSLELVGSSHRPGSYLGIPGPAWYPPAVRFSPPVKVRLLTSGPASPMRPPCKRISLEQECANGPETQSPIIDEADVDVDPLRDLRSSLDEECANEPETRLPIVDEADIDVGPLTDTRPSSDEECTNDLETQSPVVDEADIEVDPLANTHSSSDEERANDLETRSPIIDEADIDVGLLRYIRSSSDTEGANDSETRSPIIDEVGIDLGPLTDTVRASIWGRTCQETLNAVVVVETENDCQLLRFTAKPSMTDSPEDDTARHSDDDAGVTCDLPDLGADNATTIATPMEKQEGGESHHSESLNEDADIELDVILRELRYDISFLPSDECAKDDDSLIHDLNTSAPSHSSSPAMSSSWDSLASLSQGKQADPGSHPTDPVPTSQASIEPVEDEEVHPLPGASEYVTILIPTHRRSQALHVKRVEELIGCERPSDHDSAGATTEERRDPLPKWAPVDGMIIIKVYVQDTDDTWKVRVPEDITLQRFTSKLLSKLGFHVAFSGSCFDGPEYYFRTDDVFRCWVATRIRNGRNLPIAAHVVGPPPPPKTDMDTANAVSIARTTLSVRGKSASAVRSEFFPFRYRDSLDIILQRISNVFQSPIGRFHRWDG